MAALLVAHGASSMCNDELICIHDKKSQNMPVPSVPEIRRGILASAVEAPLLAETAERCSDRLRQIEAETHAYQELALQMKCEALYAFHLSESDASMSQAARTSDVDEVDSPDECRVWSDNLAEILDGVRILHEVIKAAKPSVATVVGRRALPFLKHAETLTAQTFAHIGLGVPPRIEKAIEKHISDRDPTSTQHKLAALLECPAFFLWLDFCRLQTELAGNRSVVYIAVFAIWEVLRKSSNAKDLLRSAVAHNSELRKRLEALALVSDRQNDDTTVQDFVLGVIDLAGNERVGKNSQPAQGILETDPSDFKWSSSGVEHRWTRLLRKVLEVVRTDGMLDDYVSLRARLFKFNAAFRSTRRTNVVLPANAPCMILSPTSFFVRSWDQIAAVFAIYCFHIVPFRLVPSALWNACAS